MRNALRRNRYTRELDAAREHLAYLKLWQGAVIVTEISLIGWLSSASAGASAYTVWSYTTESLGVETISVTLAFLGLLCIAGLALDAARRAKRYLDR